MAFPDNCIRGIINDGYITPDGSVGSHLFLPSRETAHQRGDGWEETSINWEDDKHAVPFTLQTTKNDGSIKYKTGVVRIPLAEIEHINTHPTTRDLLSYERQAIQNNPYHGNILFRQRIDDSMKKKLAASLAVAASNIISRE